MKITNITQSLRINSNYIKNNKPQNQQSNQNSTNNMAEEPKLFAYKDFNISFTGRTPENFYAQDFNRENMPFTMKNYLDYDYEQRQHIPPEQMMNEVFQYIELAENFDDVKKLYPNEDLFSNLHANSQLNKTSILAEIKFAKDLSSEPLFKDGKDDFGMYLLKKIYAEGKTIKEINKDFYEKDMNDAYKGIITKPIDKEITRAYGIRFPKSSFWNSFIATREEYRKFFVTLPKNTVDPNRIQANKTSTPSSKSEKTTSENKTQTPRPRKYKIQHHKKREIADDIKRIKGNINAENIEKTIRRRFGKDDPEASFIVKYLSPIMTVAADRVHLSEEMRDFVELEKTHGLQGESEYMFGRFWKKNPHILDYYAKTITDSIDMFEAIYGIGGSLPINSNLEVVTPESKNQRVIDHVSPEFLELLDYTQTIEPERNKRYEKHDRLQKRWTEHFDERYGKLEENIPPMPGIPVKPTSKPVIENNYFNENEIKEYKFTFKNGGEFTINSKKIDEMYLKELRSKAEIMPDKYAREWIRLMMDYSGDRYKLAHMLDNIRDMFEDDSQLMPRDHMIEKQDDIEFNVFFCDYSTSGAANNAINDVLMAYGYNDPEIYNYDFYLSLNNKETLERKKEIISKHKTELNTLYENYQKPLTINESRKIALTAMEFLRKYNKETSIFNKHKYTKENAEKLEMLKDMIQISKHHSNIIQEEIEKSILGYPETRSLLKKNTPKAYQQQKFEKVMDVIFLYNEFPYHKVVNSEQSKRTHQNPQRKH